MSRYLSVLRTPGARLAFTAAVLARLPISMVTLGAVLLVRNERGSYALAGVVTAFFAIGAAAGTPWWGRLLDRRPQAVVLAPIALATSALLVVFTFSVTGGAPASVLIALSTAVGLTFPPVSPAMRAAWQALLPDEADRQAAYALEAVAIEVVFIAGPLLLSLLLVTTAPVVPLLVSAGLQAAGTLGYVASSASRQASAIVTARIAQAARAAAAGEQGEPRSWMLRQVRLLAVLGVALALAAGFGNVDVSAAATAREILGNQALLGFLYLGIAGGSAVGGLWYGARTWNGSDWDRLPVSLGGLSAGLFLLAGLTDWMSPGGARTSLPVVALLILLLFTAGLCIAPSVIMQQNLIDQQSPAAHRGESQSWLNASLTAGGAAGTALAGILIDIGGAPLSFAGAGLALAVATLIAHLARPGAL